MVGVKPEHPWHNPVHGCHDPMTGRSNPESQESLMHGRTRLSLLVLVAVALFSAILPLSALRAQDNTVTVSIAIANFIENAFTEQLITDFEAQYPGIKIRLVERTNFLPEPSQDLTKYYEELEKYVSSADLLSVDSNSIAPQATLAGYYLDLAPLVAEDTALNPDDFIPAIWQSFQWDKGIWAIPYSANTYILSYEPKAFDDAGIAYPGEGWVLQDLLDAARRLTQRDAENKVTRPGIDLFSPIADAFLLRSLLGYSLFDSSTIPATPQLVNPDVEALLTAWQEADKEGIIGRSFNVAPISVVPAFALALPPEPGQEQTKRVGMLLPGGKAGLDPNGFAISAGTAHPKEAYEVAKYLSTRVELSSNFNSSPARRSLIGKEADGTGIGINIPTEVQELNNRSAEAAIALSDMRFVNYLPLALDKMKKDSIDAGQALKDVEAQAVADQQAAVDRKPNVAVTVATPPPPITAADGKVAITFGLTTFIQGPDLPNKDEWEALIADFTANDPQIGAIELKTGFEQFENATKKYDCFYLPFNAVPNAQLDKILALDPFIDADATFDRSEVVGSVLTQITREGKVWAFPVMIEPSILKYNGEMFDKSGAVRPVAGWTIVDFNDAVKALKINKDDPPAFEDAANSNGTHLMILMAAYGGLPLDFRTDPATIAYTDPKSVDAMRQVLDLAKAGYIKYAKLSNLFGGGFFGVTQEQAQIAIRTDTLNVYGFRFGPQAGGAANDPYLPTTYPRGVEFTGASYNIGVGFISATSKAPEGCYRFLSAMARNYKLFQAMPARRSLINDPGLAAVQSAELQALYQEFDRVLSDPNTIQFPSLFSGASSPTGFLLQYWLYQAWDAYVLDDKELEPALQDAEQKSKDFQECAKSLPALDTSSQEAAREYIKAFGKCATDVDPALAPIFALIR